MDTGEQSVAHWLSAEVVMLVALCPLDSTSAIVSNEPKIPDSGCRGSGAPLSRGAALHMIDLRQASPVPDSSPLWLKLAIMK